MATGETKMNIICLNGPARSGKDTVGRMIQDQLGDRVRVDKFAAPLDDIARVMLNLNDITQYKEYQQWRETRKEEPLMTWPTTMRKLLIGISEDLVKPQMGKEYFGLQAAYRVVAEWKYNRDNADATFLTLKDTIVFTDSGFGYEFDAFKNKVLEHIPDAKIDLIQIKRNGCTFDGDSRGWVHNYYETIYLSNDESLDFLKREVAGVLKFIETKVRKDVDPDMLGTVENPVHVTEETFPKLMDSMGQIIKGAKGKPNETK